MMYFLIHKTDADAFMASVYGTFMDCRERIKKLRVSLCVWTKNMYVVSAYLKRIDSKLAHKRWEYLCILSMQDQYLIEWEEEQFRSVLSDTLAQRRWKTLLTSQVVCLILDNFCLIFHGLTGD